VKCFNDQWWEGWLKRGWKNSQRQPVANRDLWEPLIDLVRSRGQVEFVWVKGHSGDPMNDLVDRMAVAHAQAR
jgi:ribonuclease HI